MSQEEEMEGLKVTWGFKDRITGADIYTIEMTKELLIKLAQKPGIKYKFPIAVWGNLKCRKRK